MIARTGLSARRSTRSIMSRSSVSSTPVCAPSTSRAFSSSSVTDWRAGAVQAEQRAARRPRTCPAARPPGAPMRENQMIGTATRVAMSSGFAQRQLLRHQLAQHQGQVGGDDDDQAERDGSRR